VNLPDAANWSNAGTVSNSGRAYAVYNHRSAAAQLLVDRTLNLILTGTSGSDSLTGAAGSDTLNGSAGADAMTGGDGNDHYYVDNAGDVVTETNAVLATGGNDTVYSALSTYTLGANIENGRIVATGAANLTGNPLSNVLYAGSGNNVLDGAGGNDTVSYAFATVGVTVSLAIATAQATGGSGSDTLISIENLTGSSFNDNLTGNAGNNILDGGLGNDLFHYTLGSGNDVITDTGGEDGIELGDSLDLLYSGWNIYRSSNDLIIDFHGQGRITVRDQYLGLPIVETLAWSDDALPYTFSNSLTASPGNDALIGTSSGEVINGGGGDDLIFGNAGNDTLSGGDGDDELNGGSGDDSLYGGAGDDHFSGQGGQDVIDGGDGEDEVEYSFESGGVIINFSGVTQNVAGHLLANGRVLHADGVTEDTLTSIEDVHGTNFADVFYGGSGHRDFKGGRGNDTIVGGTDPNSSVSAESLDGPLGMIVNLSNASIMINGVTVASRTARDSHGDTDTFVLSAGGLAIEGAVHDDYLRGRDDASTWMDGNAGNDTLIGGAFPDVVEYDDDPEGGGIYGAIVNLSASSITAAGVTGHAGNVTVGANQANDCFGDTDMLISIEGVVSSDLNDYLVGSSGANWLGGNDGNDTLDGGAGNDYLDGGDGIDTVSYLYATSTGSTGVTLDLSLVNASGQATASGISGADLIKNIENLTGSNYADRLTGNSGANILNGGTGADTLTGGDGSDTYYVDHIGDLVSESNATTSPAAATTSPTATCSAPTP
jgi:Ca2+-binding RTX toxin-like protein